MHSRAALDEIKHGSRLDRLREVPALQDAVYDFREPSSFRFMVPDMQGDDLKQTVLKALLVIGPIHAPIYRQYMASGLYTEIIIVPQTPMRE